MKLDFVRSPKTEELLPNCVLPTTKEGRASVIVWGTMRNESYLQILQELSPLCMKMLRNSRQQYAKII